MQVNGREHLARIAADLRTTAAQIDAPNCSTRRPKATKARLQGTPAPPPTR
jgi:hypothetical protein